MGDQLVTMTVLPQSLSAGVTLDRTVILPAYNPQDWTLSVLLRGAGSIDLVAVALGTNFSLYVGATESASWVPGKYWYTARVSNDTDVIEIESGEVEIKPDFAANGAGFDGRGHLERVIDAIEAVLEKRATLDQQRYTINNRELWRTPIPELLTLRDRYRAELRRMKAAKSGALFGRRVAVRFQ